MKTPNTKCIALVAAVATMTGCICEADEARLPLSGKTLTVYPIVLARPDKSIDEKTQKFGERMAEVVGLQMEQHGMLPVRARRRIYNLGPGAGQKEERTP